MKGLFALWLILAANGDIGTLSVGSSEIRLVIAPRVSFGSNVAPETNIQFYTTRVVNGVILIEPI